ncbi:MAG: pyruvate flavodoxin/ferredoxin oxidoreductase [Planctomycetota bacterium]|nr:MAG: pyruvate flavodoxin/ferredoxin oxidoreductase [Planctomycetota bacterium]
MREFLTGNQTVVRGALRAGCDFFAGYPITPASSILSDFVDAFADGGGRAVQTEDEIAAIGQCIGAAMTGARALTATSGPGMSLYSENIGLAQMGEVPLVIVDCQRMGPATGGATATGEGDVLFARHITSGGYPLPVLAATNAATAYRLTHEAFNIAERLRTPVILLSSKDIALTRQTVDLDEIPLAEKRARTMHGSDGDFHPYRVAELDDVPAFAPIGGPARVRFTGSIHDEEGLLTIDRRKIDRKLRHLDAKIQGARTSLELFDADIDPDAEALVICYGATDGAARDAVDEARSMGRRVSRLTLYSLWPVPGDAVRRAVTSYVRHLIVPELNIGLYVEEIRRVVRHGKISSLTRFDGGLIAPRTILNAVMEGFCG